MSLYSEKYISDSNILLPQLNIFSSKELDLIKKNSNMVRYNKGDVIFKQNTRTSHVMFLKNGLVKTYKESSHNKVLILKLETPNSFLGLLSVFGGDIHQYSAAAVEPSEIMYIDMEVINQLIKTNESFSHEVLKNLSITGLFIFEKLMNHYQKQLPGRIADVILYFCETIYKSEKFEFPFTRKELAELAGTTKESFIRTLTEFKNDRIIALDGKRVEIQSMKILKKLSEIG